MVCICGVYYLSKSLVGGGGGGGGGGMRHFQEVMVFKWSPAVMNYGYVYIMSPFFSSITSYPSRKETICGCLLYYREYYNEIHKGQAHKL